MTYDIDYFIAKFEAIPECFWGIGEFNNGNGQCCAYGHCGEKDDTFTYPPESAALNRIDVHESITHVNDGIVEYLYLGDTPKERVINYLKQLKNESR